VSKLDKPGGDPSLAAKLVLLTVAMFGFGFLLVPLYDVFCDLTGIGGKTGGATAAVPMEIDTGRTINLEFVTTVNGGSPWRFEPTVSRMKIHPGQLYRTTFFARNELDTPSTGQAIPSVAPGLAAKYLRKTECFCFDQQQFDGGEGREMPVVFYVDPDLPDHINTMTLSYTFFSVDRVASTLPIDEKTITGD
jgi:cytochrome c oxidase assembly protein subunit 11